MKGQALLPDELGRIYAYIWKDHRDNKGKVKETLKDKFENDPATAIKEITGKLGIDYDGRIMKVLDPKDDLNNDPADYTDDQLQKIITGEDRNYIVRIRLTC